MSTRFIQIHTLTSYPSALLNRDDAGFAKRLPFGGTERTRISSQCLKRHWRRHEGEHSLTSIEGAELSIRSRATFEKRIYKPLVESGIDEKLAESVTSAIMAEVLGTSEKAKAKAEEGDSDAKVSVRSAQVTIIGEPEVRFLLDQAKTLCGQIEDPKKAAKTVKSHFKGEAGKNLEALKLAAGVDAAMFGRMVTSDLLARGDAAVHVAHAFTVHQQESETDYFTAVDDLIQEDPSEFGSGHINTSELTSGLYYGYVVIDVAQLVSNLGGDEKLAAQISQNMINIIATVSPGAKVGSTAPHSYASLVLVETGKSQPRTLANAFLKTVSGKPDLLDNTYKALGHHLEDFDQAYTKTTDRAFTAIGPVDSLSPKAMGERMALGKLATWASDQIG